MSTKLVIERLNVLLGSISVFTRKTKHYHWNVKGRNFFTLHKVFEELYGAWAEFGDAVAERVVALGGQPGPSLADDVKVSKLKEDSDYPAADAMVKNLVTDFETLATYVRETYAVAEDDRTTEDLLDDLRDAIDGKLWMLKAYLQ